MEVEKIAPRYVQIEVTETVFLGRGADHVQRALSRLNDAGLRIALDDFGTGYASLAQRLQFPVDALKIDKSFIRGIGRNADAESITKAIVNLGQQEVHLKGLGCQTRQGFLYSKAAPMEMLSQMLVGALAKSA
jgi:EAL domain-containing protein (putative c-di-GMP-specific phosphodiesterase class I)